MEKSSCADVDVVLGAWGGFFISLRNGLELKKASRFKILRAMFISSCDAACVLCCGGKGQPSRWVWAPWRRWQCFWETSPLDPHELTFHPINQSLRVSSQLLCVRVWFHWFEATFMMWIKLSVHKHLATPITESDYPDGGNMVIHSSSTSHQDTSGLNLWISVKHVDSKLLLFGVLVFFWKLFTGRTLDIFFLF
jgi:hypothetical protein